MPVAFRVKLEASSLQRELKEMLRRGEDLRDFHKLVGAVMLRSVDRNFAARGRPKWKELSDYTIALRHWRAEKFGRPAFTEKVLEVRGELRRDWEYRTRRVSKGLEDLEVGTSHKNADVHQEGKTIPAPKRWKTRSTVQVPKRVLIAIRPQDWRTIQRLADVHLGRVVPEG